MMPRSTCPVSCIALSALFPMSKQPPANDPTRVVVRQLGSSRAAELPAKVAGLGQVQPLPAGSSGHSGWLLTLKSATRSGGGISKLHKLLQGSGLVALPLLLDDDQQPRFPTGELVVRFAKAVDDDALQELARCTGLMMVRRSSFTQNQAVFLPKSEESQDVMALLVQVQQHPGVAAVWLDAESSYKRSK
jgi:uncharacterized protein YidB (DUF937 family)